MINKAVQWLVSAVVEPFVGGFVSGFKQGVGIPEQDDDEIKAMDLPAALEQAIRLARDPDRVIRPFSMHMAKHFDAENKPNKTEFIEGMTLSLESLGKEIKSIVAGSTISSWVERTENDTSVILHGYLDWKVDNHTPEVYDISMDLLKDGFMYRVDSDAFVITGRVTK